MEYLPGLSFFIKSSCAHCESIFNICPCYVCKIGVMRDLLMLGPPPTNHPLTPCIKPFTSLKQPFGNMMLRFHVTAAPQPDPLNSLWPSDAIWRWRSWSTLVQVMVCCLMAPSHYLNQRWLIISKVLWHSLEGIILRRSEDTNQYNKIENYILESQSDLPGANELTQEHAGPEAPAKYNSVPLARHRWLPGP